MTLYSAEMTWKALVEKHKKEHILNSKYGDISSKVFLRISCQPLKNTQRIRTENVKLCFLRVAGHRIASSASNKDIRDKLETIVDFNGAINGVVD